MELTAALDIFFKHTTRIDSLWNFYIMVSLGVVGYVVANITTIKKNIAARILIATIFLLFAIFNYSAIKQEQIYRNKIFNIIEISNIRDNTILRKSKCHIYDKYSSRFTQNYISTLKPKNLSKKLFWTKVSDFLVLLTILLIPSNMLTTFMTKIIKK